MQVRVSEAGQVTIPKPLRDEFGICRGQALDLSVHEGRLVAVLADTVVDPAAAFGSLKGLPRNKYPV